MSLYFFWLTCSVFLLAQIMLNLIANITSNVKMSHNVSCFQSEQEAEANGERDRQSSEDELDNDDSEDEAESELFN